MAQQDTILSTAINEIGTMEDNQRNVKYSAEYGKPRLDWCVMFVWWVFNTSNLLSTLYNYKTASCGELLRFAQGRNMTTNNPQKGDLALFNWQGGTKPQHVGIIESISTTQITTIEGNTDATNYANNCVARKTRNRSYCVAFIHPAYSATVTTPTSTAPIENSKNYDVDPILDNPVATITKTFPVANTKEMYESLMDLLVNYYGIVSSEVASAYSDMDKHNNIHNTYWNYFLSNTYRRFVIVWDGRGSISKFFLLLISAPIDIGNIEVGYNSLAGWRIRVYDINGNPQTNKVCTIAWTASNKNAFTVPYTDTSNNYLGGYQFVIDQYGSGLSYTLHTPFVPSNGFSTEVVVFEKKGKGKKTMVGNFWRNFNKRYNSTKQPTDGEQIYCDLIEDTSLEKPRIRLKTTVLDYNYFQILGNYYYVTDCKTLKDGMVELTGECDAMATFKSSILNSEQFVLYDEDDNTELIDNRIPTKSTPVVSVETTSFRTDIGEGVVGSYVVAITGVKTVESYNIPKGNLPLLMPDISTAFDEYIQAETPFEAIKGGFKQLVGSGSVGSNIRDARWIPFSIPVESTTLVNPFYVGQYKVKSESGTDIGGHRIDQKLNKQTVTVDIPWQFSDWRNANPYTQVYLYIPFIGVLSYPSSNLIGVDSLTITSCVNYYSGDIAIEVKAEDQIIGTYGASTASSIAIGSSNINPMGVTTSILSGIGSVMTGNVLGAVGSALNAIQPLNTSVGGISSGAGSGLDMSVVCFTVCHDTIKEPDSYSSFMGTPSFELKTLSDLNGYCKCENASVECIGYPMEKQKINNILNSGFYIE